MQEITTTEKTFVCTNGVINVWQCEDGWHYVAHSGNKTVRSDDTTYINWHAAVNNARYHMQSQYGIDLKGRKS